MNLNSTPKIKLTIRQSIAKFLETLLQLLYRRTILLLILFFFAGVTAAVWNMSRLSSGLVKWQAVQNTTLYAQAIQEARTVYSSAVVDRIKAIHEDLIVTDTYQNQEGAIPVPVTFLIELGKRLSGENPGMSVRLYSDFPFPSRQSEGGAKDDFEREALTYLRQHPDEKFIRFENFHGRICLRYAQADILKPSCIGCHNTLADSPKKDWKVGDVRGILEISTPIDRVMKKTDDGLKETSLTLAGISLLGIMGIALVIARLKHTAKELELRVIERTADLRKANEELAVEQEKSERLLLNILPEPIANRLKDQHHSIADGFAEVTILFADIVKFTELSSQVSPEELVSLLNEIFSAFDRLTERYGLEKIKTIGDAYMVAGGIPNPRPDHAEAVAEMALDMRLEIAEFNKRHDSNCNIRIGINTGPVVAGVIGTKKFIYDLWGDTVNVASRMESHGMAGAIQVTADTYERLRDRFEFESRGKITIKGKGEMMTYLLLGRKE
ncbi:adenylate/guanylate cyclase domain-containing protein [Microseira wollei]|uniref:Adenylate cyclase n=1 Tax=Microseira wollei NIES-4236 TaxID=2530354 RepID=A0AAV3XSW2_9CYAN|nr:adenylate/guanylate cyclase domain-containing protein [Microseira wollei]GET44550.1 adenylate/guanylate cyclase [Microseira wollei NIES-4236]